MGDSAEWCKVYESFSEASQKAILEAMVFGFLKQLIRNPSPGIITNMELPKEKAEELWNRFMADVKTAWNDTRKIYCAHNKTYTQKQQEITTLLTLHSDIMATNVSYILNPILAKQYN